MSKLFISECKVSQGMLYFCEKMLTFNECKALKSCFSSSHQILFSNAASVGSVYFKLTNKIYLTKKINDFFFTF